MKVLVTGGAGFIGTNVVDYFARHGARVSIYDNLSRKGVQANLAWLMSEEQYAKPTLIQASVADYQQLKSAVKDSEIVIHLAGQTAVTTSILKPRLDFEANALGTFNVVEAVREVQPKAILLYASTNKVYGALARVKVRQQEKHYIAVESPSIDESEALDFYSPYGTSKGAGDQYVHDYARIYGLKTVVFRQSCIYGEHQFGVEDQGWVAHFAASVIANKPITVYGDGMQVRDLLYIDDLVAGYVAAIKKIKIAAGQVYNLGGGIDNAASLIEVLARLKELHGSLPKISYAPERQGDQKVYISNIDKAKRDLGFCPRVSVNQGLEKLYRWLKAST